MLKFRRIQDGYYARGAAHDYYIDRPRPDHKSWTLRIFTLKEVAGIWVGDARVELQVFDFKADCIAVAREYENLGPNFRSSEHGHAERFTVAVNRGLATL